MNNQETKKSVIINVSLLTVGDFQSDTNYIFHYTYPNMQGAQQIIYDGKLWFREYDERRVIAFDYSRDTPVGKLHCLPYVEYT